LHTKTYWKHEAKKIIQNCQVVHKPARNGLLSARLSR
jgi:hypothetical protein